MSLQVNSNHGVELFLGHPEDHSIPTKPSVANQDIQIPKMFERRVNHGLRVVPIRDITKMRHGFSTHGLDLIDHRLARGFIAPDSIGGDTEIAHHDPRPMAGQIERFDATQTTPCSRNDGYFSVQFTHASLSYSYPAATKRS
jgi:hypothetical protein